jgi:hypothetical protein
MQDLLRAGAAAAQDLEQALGALALSSWSSLRTSP